MKEGQTVTEYAEKAGVPQTVMTRHLLEIGDRSRDKEKGLGLVTQKADMNDLRKLSRWARLLLENPLHYACANAKLPADFEDPVTAGLQF